MPTYEYQCNACRREFEYQQRMSDPDLTTCEACGEDKLEKLISRTAFQLKGSGWYKDLYSSKPAEAMKESVDKGRPSGDAPAAKPDAAASAPAPAASKSEGGGASGGGGDGASSSGSSTTTATTTTTTTASPKPASGT